FLETTVVPFVIMTVINFVILRNKLSLSPLKFLRRDLSRGKKKRAIHLTSRIPFFKRFGIRVILQNIPNYIVAFVGILFANLLLLFGFGLPSLLDNYQRSVEDNLLCNYQYVLNMPVSMMSDNSGKLESSLAGMIFMSRVQTENEDAEEFSAYTLKSMGEQGAREENIMLYGVEDDSRYIDLGELAYDEVLLSASYAEKFGLGAGDEITLKEAYEPDTYTFKVGGVYDYSGAVCVFMHQEYLNETLDLGKSFFCGYLSDSEITDIDEEYIGSVIGIDALTKASRQLDRSMGSMADLINVLAAILFVVLIYLLSKIVIEKNAQSISMTKILGYSNPEIARLYIISSSMVIIISLIVTIPLDYAWLKPVFESVMRTEMSGWIRFMIGTDVYYKTFAVGFVSYLLVMILEYRKIISVPMDEALKNVE
ncbi:MAG: ABC transporter permease, partial [Lachnospiraceae bacterium]|nr:ABC transporter permease [Lachnospiraceae bacterium]